MDDGPVTTVLPKELRLGAPPSMPQARSYLFRQQSTLSAYDPDQQIQINIPRLQRSYLSKDSYLQFRLNGQYTPGTGYFTDSTSGRKEALQFNPDLFLDDAGAWGLFERIEIFDYLGSTILETTEGLPQLMSLLIDMGVDFTDPDHEGAIQHGLEQHYVANTNAASGQTFFRSQGASSFASVTVTSANNTITLTPSGGTATNVTIPDGTYGAPGILTNAIASLLPSGFQIRVGTGTQLEILYPTSFSISGTGATAFGFSAAAAYQATQEIINGNNRGLGFPFYNGGATLVNTGMNYTTTKTYDFSVQFSIPLPSFLGIFSKKMAPLHNGFTIILTLADKYKPMFQGCKGTPYVEYLALNTTDGGATNGYFYPVTIQAQNALEPSNDEGDRYLYGPANVPVPSTFWWQVSDVSMVCHILELGPLAESMILSTTQGQPLILHTKQMRYYRGSSTAPQSEFSLPLNLNVASLTNVLWFMRPDGTDSNINFQSIGMRHKNFLQRWEFQYGSTTLPQSNGIQSMYMSAPSVISGASNWTDTKTLLLNGYTECISELLKARPTNPAKGRLSRHNVNHSTYTGLGTQTWAPQTPFKSTDLDIPASLEAPPGKFACGLNTELVRGKTGELISGLNTNGMNTSIRGYFHPNYLTDSDKLAVNIDAYAEFDAFINISPGIATTVSF